MLPGMPPPGGPGQPGAPPPPPGRAQFSESTAQLSLLCLVYQTAFITVVTIGWISCSFTGRHA
eukprot:scaffold582952_cov14-Prasinocladus_malaysianus.AAC.1